MQESKHYHPHYVLLKFDNRLEQEVDALRRYVDLCLHPKFCNTIFTSRELDTKNDEILKLTKYYSQKILLIIIMHNMIGW